jgi:hypothetical protein
MYGYKKMMGKVSARTKLKQNHKKQVENLRLYLQKRQKRFRKKTKQKICCAAKCKPFFVDDAAAQN